MISPVPQFPAGGVFSISSRLPFADVLAAGLLADYQADPLALARVLILLPTRRARRTLKDAFLRQSGGKPLVLPRLATVSDIIEDEPFSLSFTSDTSAETTDIPPEIPSLKRLILLTRLVMASPSPSTTFWSPAQAAGMARHLAHFLDDVQTAGLDFEALNSLVPEDYARHWQITLDFLKIISQIWPRILADEGCIDPAQRRNRLLLAQARAWEKTPPPHPVIAAGLTGTIPAVTSLLEKIARLPNGFIILPGLDRFLDEDSWLELDESHPQAAFKALLDHLALSRDDIRDWPCSLSAKTPPAAKTPPERERLLSEALRPASSTHRWRHMVPIAPEALRTSDTLIERIDCPTPREEALVIALHMRHALEQPEKTCALITPDRDLARRVIAELGRWGIRLDDSAGKPLSMTAIGAFLRLITKAVGESFAPVPLLAMLQHPLASGGVETPAFREMVRTLDMTILRGPRPLPGLDGLTRAIRSLKDVPARTVKTLDCLLDRLTCIFSSLLDIMSRPEVDFSLLLSSHLQTAEALAENHDTAGPLRLWCGEAGESAAAFAAELAASAKSLGSIAPLSYPPLFDALMQGQVVRSDIGLHPRLFLWGPMESRLQQADVIILGGLNDDRWPPRPDTDLWMNRPMRRSFGLPLNERRIGQMACDFANAFCAPHVILTRSEKIEGTPTTPSRWLLRLDTVMSASGITLPRSLPWLSWAEQLDVPPHFSPHPAPRPTPPVTARPKGLSVTKIGLWMSDPYAIYAQYILGLNALEAVDTEPGAAEYGILVHQAFEDFHRRFPTPFSPETPTEEIEREILHSGQLAFSQTISRPSVAAFWWPRFERLATWAAKQDILRTPFIERTWVEVKGSVEIDGFRITAKADRIDALKDGTLAILDYKTGQIPSQANISAGYAPQLPLEALIAQKGGFHTAGIPAHPISDILFWHLNGSSEGGREISASGKNTSPQGLIDTTLAGVQALIAAFSRQETPYLARPRPDKAPDYSDYAHLARIREWSTDDDGSGE